MKQRQNKALQDAAFLAHVADTAPEAMDIAKIWTRLTPEQKKLAMAKLQEMVEQCAARAGETSHAV